MLDGINVLNTIETYKDFPIWLLVLVIIFLTISVFCLFEEENKIKIVGLIFSILCLTSLIGGGMIANEPTGEYNYQVTIDESVSMVDFTSKYDIIRVDGEIYTIREKESE